MKTKNFRTLLNYRDRFAIATIKLIIAFMVTATVYGFYQMFLTITNK